MNGYKNERMCNSYIRGFRNRQLEKKWEDLMRIAFLVGNGFDRALDNAKVRITGKESVANTAYKGAYDFFERYDFLEHELKDNVFVGDLLKTTLDKCSDWEKLMVEEFNAITSSTEWPRLFRDKDNTVAFIKEVFRLWEKAMNAEAVYEKVFPEFRKSLIELFERIDPSDLERLESLLDLNDRFNKEDISVGFVTFNGTNILERFVQDLSVAPVEMRLNGKNKPVKLLPEVHYVHSNIHCDEEAYISKAFGTTDKKKVYKLDNNNIPTSVKCSLIKTNPLFKEWIKEADLIVVHGLSLGESDSQYMQWIMEQVEKKAVLLDFPLNNTDRLTRTRLYTDNSRNPGIDSKIIIGVNPKCNVKGALLFDF